MVCCCLVTKSCPTLCDSKDGSLPGSSVCGISQARIQEWFPFLLQEIFPTQELNLHLLHWQADSLPLSPLGGPKIVQVYLHGKWYVVYLKYTFKWAYCILSGNPTCRPVFSLILSLLKKVTPEFHVLFKKNFAAYVHIFFSHFLIIYCLVFVLEF